MNPLKKLVLVLSCGSLPVAAHAQNLPSNDSPVLVELFTSQGCSSCPPAEDLLNTWGMDQFQKGVILPLAFHVDYWNGLGWRDPFSTSSFTDRQRSYATVLPASLYTPQMIVSGRVDFVGSDTDRAKRETDSFRGRPAAEIIRLKVRPRSKDILVNLDLTPIRPWKGTRPIYWVLFENGLVTKVQGGENKGKTLEENFVVRGLGKLSDAGTNSGSYQTVIPWQDTWKRSKCGVGIFLQDTATLAIQGVKWVYPIQD